MGVNDTRKPYFFHNPKVLEQCFIEAEKISLKNNSKNLGTSTYKHN